MRRSLPLFIFICTLSSCGRKLHAYIGSYSPAIHKYHLLNEDHQRQLYYYRSCKKDSAAIMFIIGGSGHSSARYTLSFYARPLRQLDANVYMLQKRHVADRETGMGKVSSAFWEDYYFTRMAADQECFIKQVLNSPENRNKKVIILGVSEGATIAAKVVADMQSQTNYLAIIGGGGMKQADEFKIMYPQQTPKFDTLYALIKKDPLSLELMAMGYTYRYWSDILFRDPVEYYQMLHIPILVGIGALDKNTAPGSASYLQHYFEEQHKANLTYIEYKGCDHALTDQTGKSHLPDFFRAINDMAMH